MRLFLAFVMLGFATGCVSTLGRQLDEGEQRWFNATGLNVRPKLITLRNAPLPCNTFADSSGCTHTRELTIEFNVQQLNYKNAGRCIIAHEFGHLLAKRADHATGDNHVMSWSPDFVDHCTIDDDDIEFVCKTNSCTRHVAERKKR